MAVDSTRVLYERRALRGGGGGDNGDQLRMRRAGVNCVQWISVQEQRQRPLWRRIFGPSKNKL